MAERNTYTTKSTFKNGQDSQSRGVYADTGIED